MDHKEKLKTLLSELFRLDQKDLDFGIYRVMRARADEIQRFLDEKLLEHIHEELKSIPAQSERLEAEREVYEHLYRFFRRYYSEGDFISQRIYREGTYAIPYSGEEVMLHWANKDQYYVKSAEHLRDYSFVIMVGGTERRVHFKLVDVEEGEHGNVKPEEGKHRRFMLLSQSLNDLEEGAHEGIDLELEGDELTVQFAYRQDRATQANLNTKILTSLNSYAQAIAFGLNEEVLNSHINRYVARNTFDFFIHKDLGGFLTRELDHFVKTEVLELDDLERIEDSVISRKLSRVRALRVVAGKLIKFLASLEDFQKKLWLKKKFVVENYYLVSINLIPEAYWDRILSSKRIYESWLNLGLLGKPPVEYPINKEFLHSNPSLTIDSRLIDDFEEILEFFPQELLERPSGVLINSDNFHGLNLAQNRYCGEISSQYIDPPYNTAASEIIYKNSYKHSSWCSLMYDRLSLSKKLVSEKGFLTTAIDHAEIHNLTSLKRSVFGDENQLAIVTVQHNPKGRNQAEFFSENTEYMLFFARNRKLAKFTDVAITEKVIDTFMESDADGRFRYEKYQRERTSWKRTARPNNWYPIYVSLDLRYITLEVDDKLGHEFHTVYPRTRAGEFSWKNVSETADRLIRNGKMKAAIDDDGEVRIFHKYYEQEVLKNLWIEKKYQSEFNGTNVLKDMFAESDLFSYPKSIYAIQDVIKLTTEDDSIILDFFGGSGTTAHSTIMLNREDGKKRSFLLIEMSHYFNTVVVPRVQKIAYTSCWSAGFPIREKYENDIQPKLIKVVCLESYEDTLNNLELKRTDDQADALQQADLYEEYMLSYLFDQEAEGNALLSTSAFKNPTAYTLNIKRPGGEETVETTVDLIETFNWLIGLRVHHMRAPITTHGWHRLITGELPNGMKALIIWRKLTDDITDDNIKLNQLFVQEISAEQRAGLDVIYVNGCCDLDSVKTPQDHWKVELLDEHFTRLMFDTSDVEA